MQWTDDGIVLGVKRHGEANAILELMTHGHGRHLGLVRGGFGSRLRPILQPGNSVSAAWRARLDEHLGNYTVEGLRLRAASYFSAPHAIYGVTHLAALMRLLPERDPHSGLFEALGLMIEHLDDAAAAAELIVRFELLVLEELGFGLALAACAATGSREDLAYVSPRSGRAVSRVAGAPWAERMLVLPGFLAAHGRRPEPAELEAAFRLTDYFFHRHVYEPRGLTAPEARAGFVRAWRRCLVGNGSLA